MKNVFLLLLLIAGFNIVQSQWAIDPSTGFLVSNNQVLQVKNDLNSPTLTFSNSGSQNWLWFALANGNTNDIFTVRHEANNGTWIGLKNTLGQELFKLSTLANDNQVFLHMPKPDSRVVIGHWGTYLQSEGHKLVVKDGSAKIEGNIFTNSNIGIGTDSFVDGTDTYRLSVDGKIRAEGVKVYTGWADYVFEDTYELPTLEQVEAYIAANGHLKDVPSAKEVEENGIEIGEMNKLLLQKIEELTLYTIQLKKEIDELKRDLNED